MTLIDEDEPEESSLLYIKYDLIGASMDVMFVLKVIFISKICIH